ncbi:hypothetical protein J7337_003537 [Fusarium musae]|uniref:Uncharacterized protein n=1 Tax=Fusarium musae TaxID=1042133 RepID=A0A9P8IQG1_9HYPO|nr:hypothetical protein J7337_003537 [Fusarium musae]KAG9503586.1 hypothetical protein J7337_003537 [Fusarium musae]
MDAETVDDARDLITIVSFLLCGPLYGILTAPRRKAETHTYKRTFDRYAEEIVKLLEAIENAHKALNIIRPGHFWQTLEILESILVSGRWKPVTITPIVPIELLMRVVAARKKWDSLSDRRKGITNAVHGGGKDAKLVKEWSEALESRRKRSEEKNQKMEPLASLIENPPG